MVFLIQENLFREEHYDMLIEIMKKHNFDYRIVELQSDSDIISNIDDLPHNNIFCFGSLKMARISRNRNWLPGSFMNDNHDYEAYSKGFGVENMLNSDSIICKFSDSLDFSSGNLFIRPTKDSKVFTGKVFDKFEWYDFVENSLYNNMHVLLNSDTLIQVCKPKQIQQEVRCWIVKGKLITTSYYKLGSVSYMAECNDSTILDFAQKMVDTYQPADSFVIDICLVNNEPKIVEINCINCSGFYKQNLSKLIDSLLVYDLNSLPSD